MKAKILNSPRALGLVVLGCVLLLALYSFNQQRVLTTVSSGEGLKAEFTRAYQLNPYQSVVKVAGVKVGTVTGDQMTSDGHTVVDMKLDDGTLAKLGTTPRAIVRPTTLLGGRYYVELVRDGAEGAPAADSTIPMSRTAVPVELDKILSTTTQPGASAGIQHTVSQLSKTLTRPGRASVRHFLATAPADLTPAAEVLKALEGTRPGTDLTTLTKDLQSTADGLTRTQDEVGAILDGLSTTSAVLDAHRSQIASTLAQGASTLQSTRQGLASLSPTLDKLTTTANSFRPSAQRLSSVLTTLGPVLKRTRPVIADTKVVAREARPMVQVAVPTASRATGVLDDVKGPVLQRLDGPITDAVLSPWHGTGVYKGGGNDHLLYQETGYLLANIADVFKFHDHNQQMGRLMAGVGLSTADGIIGESLYKYLNLGTPGSGLVDLGSSSPDTSGQTGSSSTGSGTGTAPSKSPLLGGLLGGSSSTGSGGLLGSLLGGL